MARTFTAGELRTRVRDHADMANSSFVSDAEMLRYLSANYCALYDELVTADPERFRTEQTITVGTDTDTSGRKFAVASDYYGTIKISYNTDNNTRDPLRRAYGTELDRYNYSQTDTSEVWAPVHNTTTPATQKIELLPPPNSGEVYTHTYIVAPAELTTASDTVNGVSGWEKYIILLTVLDCRDKEETPTGSVERQIAAFQERLQRMRYNRDAANSGRVVNTRGDNRRGWDGLDEHRAYPWYRYR